MFMCIYMMCTFMRIWMYVCICVSTYICIVYLFCSTGQNVPVLVQHILCTVAHELPGRGGEEGCCGGMDGEYL